MTCLNCSTISHKWGMYHLQSPFIHLTSINNSPVTHINTYTMGFFKGSAPQQLLPVNPPLGVYPNFIAKVPTVLTLKESLFSLSGVSHFFIVSRDRIPSAMLMCRMTLPSRMAMGTQWLGAKERHFHSGTVKVNPHLLVPRWRIAD